MERDRYGMFTRRCCAFELCVTAPLSGDAVPRSGEGSGPFL
jgi:hypothetical protein